VFSKPSSKKTIYVLYIPLTSQRQGGETMSTNETPTEEADSQDIQLLQRTAGSGNRKNSKKRKNLSRFLF
jgi:hypothetical protein